MVSSCKKRKFIKSFLCFIFEKSYKFTGVIFMTAETLNYLKNFFDSSEMDYVFVAFFVIIFPRQDLTCICYLELQFLNMVKKISLTC